ncbi:MAG: proton-conducting transporter membrane subunit [Bacteroidota bacterium]|nr:proton-conducting transporter membrane subunit [Bacteroidota bacterium]
MSVDVVVWCVLIASGLSVFIIPFLSPQLKSSAAFILVLLIAILSLVLALPALRGSPVEHVFYGSSAFGNIPVRIDALSAWFILIVNFTCVNGALYGIGYMKPYENKKGNSTLHWILFVWFQVSMLAVCVVQNSLVFLIAWELMSISSLLLVIFEHYKPETLKAGVNYLVQMHIGVVMLSIAFIWVYISQHSLDFEGIKASFNHQNSAWLFLLFFVGFAIKAGFIPFHTWLPLAHPAAPSHISGVMSGVIVKMGIYGILRMVSYLNSELILIGIFVLILSMTTAFYGILNAAVVRDFKRMLAFCTIENIGIIGMGIGMGMIGKGTGNTYLMLVGYTGALLHTLNHSLYKSLLFYTAGNIYQQTHTRNMEHLGGLIKKMPASALFFLCGALAIGGLPPFSGFISEFIIYSGLIEGLKSDNIQYSSLMMLCLSGLAIVGGVSMITFTKAFGTIFLGSARTKLNETPKEVSVVMQIPLYLILLTTVLIGIFPNLVYAPALSVATAMSGIPSFSGNILSMSPVLAIIGRVSLLMIVLSAIVYFIRTGISSAKPAVYLPTWACGYSSINTRMQYTAKSYSKSFAKLFSFIVSEKKKYIEIGNSKIFPLNIPRTFTSNYEEFFEKNFIAGINKRILAFMNYFMFIHNGRLQMYILYGFFFIVILIIATLFNLL